MLVEREAEKLRHAQRAWAELTPGDRLAHLERFAVAMERHGDAIVAALIADTGRVAASIMEAGATRALVDRWAARAPVLLADDKAVATTVDGISMQSQRVPYPLVGVISPWNSPLGLTMIDAIPALVAGCAVIAKPSEVTQHFIAPLAKAIAAVPELAAVFTVLAGDGVAGAAIVETADAICFTGSVATGRRVAMAAAGRLIPAFLELGGKDAAIVLEGADLERAAGGIAWSGTFNSGQLCHSIERVYVTRAVAAPFLDRLVERIAGLTIARPPQLVGAIGRFIDPSQADIVERHLADAFERGARALTGGKIEREAGQCWCQPTVLVDVDHSMAIMREETFGPILPVMVVADAEAAIALANDSPYGLSASVWGVEHQALSAARRLNAGAVSVNDASLSSIVFDAEKHAFGHSGLGGSRMGDAGLLRFLRKKALLVSRIEGDDPWW